MPKKPCTCGECSVIASTRLAPGGGEQIGHQPAADRDARRVLLVRSGVRVVRHHHGDPGGRRAPGRVEHQQQLDQVLLDRRHQRLDQEDVALAAVGLQLHLEAVVGEPPDLARLQGRSPGSRRSPRPARGWALPLKTVMSRTAAF